MSVSTKLRDLQVTISGKQAVLARIFDEAGPDLDLSRVKSITGTTQQKTDEIRRLNRELDDLAAQAEGLRRLDRGVRGAVGAGMGEGGFSGSGWSGGSGFGKSFGEAFTESDAFGVKNRPVEIEVELKTLFDTSTGAVPDVVRRPAIVESAQRPIQIVDLIPQTTTDQTAISYLEETTFTNAAAETAEGAAKPEGALALTERTSPVRKLAVWIPVTQESMEDLPRFRAYLDSRLSLMIRQRLDTQIVSGNGTAPNLRGIMNVSGIQTQAKGTDPVPDAIYRAMVKVQVTGQAMPDAVIVHPNDWLDVRLLRTADGIYLWGNPSDAGPERIWGMRVAVVQAATEGTAVVGDFGNFSELAVKKQLVVEMTDSHLGFFTENKVAVRCEMRAALVWSRPAAFATVTGI